MLHFPFALAIFHTFPVPTARFKVSFPFTHTLTPKHKYNNTYIHM